MRELGVSELPVYGADGRRQGTVSRDMIVRRIATGGDPRVVTVGELAPAPVPPRQRPQPQTRAALTGDGSRAGGGRPAPGETGRAGPSAPRMPAWLP